MQNCFAALFKVGRAFGPLGIFVICVASSGWATFSAASAPSQAIHHAIPTERHSGGCGNCLVVGQSNLQSNESDIDTQGLTRDGIDESGLSDGGMDDQDLTTEGIDSSGTSSEGIGLDDMTTEGIDQSDLTTEGVEDPAFISPGPRIVTIPQSDSKDRRF